MSYTARDFERMEAQFTVWLDDYDPVWFYEGSYGLGEVPCSIPTYRTTWGR